MAGIKPEAAKAQYYAGSPEQAFHLSRPCRFPAQPSRASPVSPKRQNSTSKPTNMIMDYTSHKFIPNHKKYSNYKQMQNDESSVGEPTLCVPHILKREKDASAKGLRSGLSDEQPSDSESHSALFHMSTPQGTPSPLYAKFTKRPTHFQQT